MVERRLLGDLASLLNQGASSSEWTVDHVDACLEILPEVTHLEFGHPDVYACLDKCKPLKDKLFETRGQYDSNIMNRVIENFWLLDNNQENCIRTNRHVKNLERYLCKGVFPRIVEHMEWVLDETMWPISLESFQMLSELVSCHPNCNTQHWKGIELYFKDLNNMNDHCESFFDKEQ